MSVMADSRGRNSAIIAGITGVMVGLLIGISITSFGVSAAEGSASATGGRGAGLVAGRLFEAPLVVSSSATGGRGAGLVAGRLFEAPLVVSSTATGGRGAGLVAGRLFEAPLVVSSSATGGRGAGLVAGRLFEAPLVVSCIGDRRSRRGPGAGPPVRGSYSTASRLRPRGSHPSCVGPAANRRSFAVTRCAGLAQHDTLAATGLLAPDDGRYH